MPTYLRLECSGCGDTETGTVRLNRLAGQTVAAAVPEGWVWSDPYTYCTYCATCWAKIDAPVEY